MHFPIRVLILCSHSAGFSGIAGVVGDMDLDELVSRRQEEVPKLRRLEEGSGL
jgi:hypothetical protein